MQKEENDSNVFFSKFKISRVKKNPPPPPKKKKKNDPASSGDVVGHQYESKHMILYFMLLCNDYVA